MVRTQPFMNLLSGLIGVGRQQFSASSTPDRCQNANDVRNLARSVESHSPGFAADLYAAADRHESVAEEFVG